MLNHDDSINAVLEGEVPLEADACCIYKEPFDIRKLNEDAYTPKVVSIGPFHHNRHPRLQNMKAFLERTQTSFDSWISYIEGLEPSFRRCYSDTLHFTKEELVNIIFVDSVFIFELFWSTNPRHWPQNGTLLLKSWLIDTIKIDLLLLENQLPFSVLEDLFNFSFSSTASTSGHAGNNTIPSFLELTVYYFDKYNTSKMKFHEISNSIRHFTDLIRTFYLPRPLTTREFMADADGLAIHLPTVTELSEVGVRFKRNTESECLLDMKFSGRVLEIPQLKVSYCTELLFRNMVALEQCHDPYESYITDYVAVLDFLVNTSRDVDILVRKGVLLCGLGDTHSVANLFNGLMKNVTHTNCSSHFVSICKDLNAVYRNRWHNLTSTLKRDYCRTPWKTAATIAAFLLLVLSVIQTVCSVLQVIQQ